jgi:hypothetical protein
MQTQKMSLEVKGLIKTLTVVFTTIAIVLGILAFLKGFQENVSSVSNLIAYLLAWYAYSFLTETILQRIKGILHAIGIPIFVILFAISIMSLAF